ncbi:hypothetical protein DUI87_17812 [Hirundo rustica rustica]|uniref:Uncharacterized protein n=1 Tax=Hirundo rustica rustica TaxID=333673 RepID=A0A3M0JZU8_HIRRU|nr:hypothetical protein DUI87_17812 [Hirundo rustica rustica]
MAAWAHTGPCSDTGTCHGRVIAQSVPQAGKTGGIAVIGGGTPADATTGLGDSRRLLTPLRSPPQSAPERPLESNIPLFSKSLWTK